MENTEMTPRERIVEEEISTAKARAEKRIAELELQPVIAAYTAEMNAARGKKHEVQRVIAKYKAMGLDTGQIGFRNL